MTVPVPPQIRAILAGAVAFVMAKIGIALTGEQALSLIVFLFWAVGGLIDYAREYRAKQIAKRLAMIGAISILLAGCGSINVVCKTPIEFGSATMTVADNTVVAEVEVLACGLPVMVSSSVTTLNSETLATICVQPPSGKTYCEMIGEGQ